MRHLLAALVLASFALVANAGDLVKEKTYATSKDATFHAALDALRDVGANVQKSDFDGGTIFAQTVKGTFMVRATNWNVTLESVGQGKVQVRLDRAGFNSFKTTATEDNDPKPYAEFFTALDQEVAKRAGQEQKS